MSRGEGMGNGKMMADWNGLDACTSEIGEEDGNGAERWKDRPGTKPSLADRCYTGGETRCVRERGTLFSVGE